MSDGGITQHRLFGLLVQSERALATVPLQAASNFAPLATLTIRVQPKAVAGNWDVLFSVEEPADFLTIFKQGKRYRLRFYGAHEFVFDSQTMQVTCVVGDTPWPVLEQILVDQVLPRIAQSLGALAIHASAVLTEPGVVAFVGESGAGKSTICSEFMRRDFPLVCDDCLTITSQDDGLMAWPGYNSVRLWPDSAARFADDLPLATPRTTKRRLQGHGTDLPHPVRALFFLEPQDEELLDPVFTRIRGAEGLKILTTCLHRLEPGRRDLLQSEFTTIHHLLADALFYRVAYEQTVDAAPVIASKVEALLATAAR